MKVKVKYLEKRYGNYCFRYTVPKDLHDVFDRKEIRRSLDEMSLKNATQLCSVYAKCIHKLCEFFERSPVMPAAEKTSA